MLFNSLEFVFLFLPVTLFGFFQIGGRNLAQWAIAWLLSASLVFYSHWNSTNLLVLLSSVLVNYGVGSLLSRTDAGIRRKKGLLIAGIALNLSLIGYFKYANFLADTTNHVLGTRFNFGTIALPLGISFFTFQQIAYLVDAYRGDVEDSYSFLSYATFVTFFPHLLAGPLIYHKEVITQFSNKAIYRFNPEGLAIGITLFSAGLFKKIVFADGVALYANQAFAAAATGKQLTLLEAWIGALAYTLQLYFDFSGYSDMAIGLARMFGIRLPINFNSPYKSVNIIEFWRRWHITLSNFLKNYLYIPLGGNRQGSVRRGVNLMVTMLLGGLWHGAGWTFVVWGGLHGIYLLINHQWRSFRQQILRHDLTCSTVPGSIVAGGLTFIAVVFGWVIFRAETIEIAASILRGMIGLHGISLPVDILKSLAFLEAWPIKFDGWLPNLDLEVNQLEDSYSVNPLQPVLMIATLLAIVWLMPNTQQWLEPKFDPLTAKAPVMSFWSHLRWKPSRIWAIIAAVWTTIALLNLSQVSEFLYFEF